MAEKKYFWLKMPRNFFEKHYIKILRAKDNGDLLVMFYIWMITESIDHEGKLRFSDRLLHKRYNNFQNYSLWLRKVTAHYFYQNL